MELGIYSFGERTPDPKTGRTISAEERIRRLLEETRPSILGFWTSDGFVSNEDAKSCIRLLGQEVLPAVREMGKELGLWSPFEANAPVSIAYAKGPAPVAA